MTAKELAEILMQNPDNEVYVVDNEIVINKEMYPVIKVFNNKQCETFLRIEA